MSTTSGSGYITVTHSAIHHNQAVNGGGLGSTPQTAIGFVDMQVTVEDSAIYSNTATGVGNLRGNGGGIANADGTLNVINSTVSGNRAVSDGSTQTSGLGGGILNGSFALPTQFTVRNSTIAHNLAVVGGGLLNGKLSANGNPVASFQNSLLAGNTDVSTLGPGCFNQGTLTSLGHNLEDGTSCGFNQPSDLRNTNPELAPLAANPAPGADPGPATWTHALLDNSPAIDAADSAACPATDQRGVARPVGDGCDIRAYEGGTRTALFTIFLPLAVR